MQALYETYGEIAEFRIVYINEAHASDSSWPVEYAEEKGITEHDDYGDRCSTAEMLLGDKSLTIPTVIDGMDNAVNSVYQAWPDRAYLVRTDGKLAVAGKRGPWGFEPSLKEIRTWLAAFQEDGTEPDLVIPEATAYSFETDDATVRAILGEWNVWVAFKNREIESELVVGYLDGTLTGEWSGFGAEAPIENLSVSGNTVSFTHPTKQGDVSFTGTVDGDALSGVYARSSHELTVTGERRTR